jgi:hypothetical protein
METLVIAISMAPVALMATLYTAAVIGEFMNKPKGERFKPQAR